MSDGLTPEERAQAEKRRNMSILFIIAFLVAVSGAAIYALSLGARPADIAIVGFVAFAAVIVAFAAAVLWQIIEGNINLFGIIAEPDSVATVERGPKASLSRFQFLVFTFVIAGLFLMLSIESGGFVAIPDSVLVLLGLSGGGFVVSKAVSQNGAKGGNEPDDPDPIALAEEAERLAKKAEAAAKAARDATAAAAKKNETQ